MNTFIQIVTYSICVFKETIETSSIFHNLFFWVFASKKCVREILKASRLQTLEKARTESNRFQLEMLIKQIEKVSGQGRLPYVKCTVAAVLTDESFKTVSKLLWIHSLADTFQFPCSHPTIRTESAEHDMSLEFHLAWLECFFLQSSSTASKRAKAQEFAHMQILFWYLKQHMKARKIDHVNSSIKYEHGNTSIVPICASHWYFIFNKHVIDLLCVL